MRSCYACGAEIGVEVHRSTVCPSCNADVRVCRNCQFYAPGAHWDCRETVPENVLDKERANFCEYFRFGTGRPQPPTGGATREEARKKLDRLLGP